jgi:hypothetical protein
MKHEKAKISVLLLGLGLTANAQQATNAIGGDASGSGGTAAFSIGQVVYTTHTGSNGSVAQGVQQPYEISIILGVEDQQISLNMQTYPNPTNDNLQLKFESEKLQDLTFQLYDLTGKLIENKKITSTTENIRMENLSSATYFLKVTNNNQEVKTFKIIKN